MSRLSAGAVLCVALAVAATACTAHVHAEPPSSACSSHNDEFQRSLAIFDDRYRVTPICVADVGPGLDAADLSSEFASVAAADVTNISVQGPDKPLLVLAAFVGTPKSTDGRTWVARWMSTLGPEAAHGTVEIADRTVQFVDLRPDGPRGFAYGDDETVVIAYIRAPLGPPSHPLTPLEVDSVFTHIVAANTATPVPGDPSTGSYIDRWPLARGNFTSPTNPGWMYFRSDGQGYPPMFCAMSPDGAMVGCDIDFPPERAPAGTNQIILDSAGLRYAQSETPTFTRAGVDVAWIGERIENGPAACAMTDQAPMACRVVIDGSVVHGAFW